jgi:hypothetical protein
VLLVNSDIVLLKIVSIPEYAIATRSRALEGKEIGVDCSLMLEKVIMLRKTLNTAAMFAEMCLVGLGVVILRSLVLLQASFERSLVRTLLKAAGKGTVLWMLIFLRRC